MDKPELSVISQWHEIITSHHTSQVNSVLFQEIINILKKIHSYPPVEQWFSIKDELFAHISGKNPHNVTLEQLGVDVLYRLYYIWVEEGHSGTLEEFTKILFNFIYVTSDIDEFINSNDPDFIAVGTVSVLRQYVNIHNTNILNIHENLLDTIYFSPNTYTIIPALQLNKYMNIPINIKELYNPDTNMLEDIPLCGYMDFTIQIESNYESMPLFILPDKSLPLKISIDSYLNLINVEVGEITTSCNLTPLVDDLLHSPSSILIIVSVKNNDIYIYASLQNTYEGSLPIQSNYKKWDLSFTYIPVYKSINITDINDTSYLLNFSYFNQYLTEDEVKYFLSFYI